MEVNYSLPTIPELITSELPHIKIFILLRDSVKRAVSAYNFWARRGAISPFSGLKETAEQLPKMRILEYGYYARYIRVWKKFVLPERMRIFIFEEDIQSSPEETIKNAYSFLGLDAEFKPHNPRTPRHKSMGWARLAISYCIEPLSKKATYRRPIAKALDTQGNRIYHSEQTKGKNLDFSTKEAPFRLSALIRRISHRVSRSKVIALLDNTSDFFFKPIIIKEKDMEFLRSVYLPEKNELENLIGRNLDCWNYGYSH